MSIAPHADERRVSGWERVLDAFMAAPDRTLTNVALGHVPGVQAFHQRLSTLGRYGYVFTPAVRLKAGRYAYTLVGIVPSEPWPFTGARPYADRLQNLAPDEIGAVVNVAVAVIRAQADDLVKRERQAPAPRPVRPRAVTDSVRLLQETLGDHTADWSAGDREDILALTRKTCTLLEESREVTAEMDRRLAASLPPFDARVLGEELDGAQADRNLSRSELDDISAVLGLDANASGHHGVVLECIRALAAGASPAPRRAAGAMTGPQIMRKALEFHKQPMHAERLAEWVMANGGTDIYRGQTPAKTMRGQLLKSDAAGGEFVKIAPNVYGLREWGAGENGIPRKDQAGTPLLELEPIR